MEDCGIEQTVRIPSGLIPELKLWIEGELEWAVADTAYCRDLATLYDRLPEDD